MKFSRSISDLLENEVLRKEGHQRAPHPHTITHAVTLFILLSQGCRRAHERTKRKKWTLSGLRYWSPLTCFLSFCAGGSKALERSAIFCQKREKKITLICKYSQTCDSSWAKEKFSGFFFSPVYIIAAWMGCTHIVEETGDYFKTKFLTTCLQHMLNRVISLAGKKKCTCFTLWKKKNILRYKTYFGYISV